MWCTNLARLVLTSHFRFLGSAQTSSKTSVLITIFRLSASVHQWLKRHFSPWLLSQGNSGINGITVEISPAIEKGPEWWRRQRRCRGSVTGTEVKQERSVIGKSFGVCWDLILPTAGTGFKLSTLPARSGGDESRRLQCSCVCPLPSSRANWDKSSYSFFLLHILQRASRGHDANTAFATAAAAITPQLYFCTVITSPWII